MQIPENSGFRTVLCMEDSCGVKSVPGKVQENFFVSLIELFP